MKLGEVILYVENMDRQVAFYRDTLGFDIEYPKHKSDYAEEFWVVFETGACRLALHGGGCRRLGADSPKIVFVVPDIQDAKCALEQRGAELSEIRSPAPGVFVCDGVDPEGNRYSIESKE